MYPLIRALFIGDLKEVVDIEQVCYPFPWTLGIFEGCLKAGYACFGLQLGDDLAGYAVSNWGVGECHLLNLCIHPRWQKQGYGKMMLDHSIGRARSLDCHVMFLEVRPSNVDAGHLYRHRGFEEVGMRPAYYQADKGREDALVMRLDLLDGLG
ncbi:MAG: ribosomal-protein-alanine N-acetyltransferase [Lysobacterales bacterium]|jgi:ribosomal-protein-alanine N-acetyltransferase